MKTRLLLTAIAAAALSSTADAHFVLVSPAASLVQNRLGDPQKQAPCGGVSANPGRGTAANPGTPSQGLFAHTEHPTGLWETDVEIPNIDCPNCVLQVIQFMAEHARNMDGDYSYHHCAVVDITADLSKPLDNRWGPGNR